MNRLQPLEEERVGLIHTKSQRALTREEEARLELLTTLLRNSPSVPREESLAELGRRVGAVIENEVPTRRELPTAPPSTPPPRTRTEPSMVAPPKTLSGTLSIEATERLDGVLGELERRGFSPKGMKDGTIGQRGRALFHEASELRTIFDGLAAMQRAGMSGAELSAEDRRKLVARVGNLEREYGAFLVETRNA